MTGEDSKVIAQEGGIFPVREHQINFIESLRTRNKPNCTVEQGHLSVSLVHLGNIACRVGNKQLNFDPAIERFIGYEDADRMLKTSYHENYKIFENV